MTNTGQIWTTHCDRATGLWCLLRKRGLVWPPEMWRGTGGSRRQVGDDRIRTAQTRGSFERGELPNDLQGVDGRMEIVQAQRGGVLVSARRAVAGRPHGPQSLPQVVEWFEVREPFHFAGVGRSAPGFPRESP